MSEQSFATVWCGVAALLSDRI